MWLECGGAEGRGQRDCEAPERVSEDGSRRWKCLACGKLVGTCGKDVTHGMFWFPDQVTEAPCET